jgi:ABC-type lipoprotein export system ATPase subunit
MTQHPLDNWKQYLTDDDYTYLIKYIENIKHNISNDKMVILSGRGGTGKSTLKNDIEKYLGNETCQNYKMSGEIIYNENIKKLGFFCLSDEIKISKKNNRAIINLIKYKQSFIADTCQIERVNISLLEFSKIIEMNHIF